jgi:hypothetical protein
MTAAKVLKLPVTVRTYCSKCFAAGTGSCSCNAPYVTAGAAAAAAIAADPNKSDRAIAAVIGVDHKTISKVRKSTGEYSPVGRIGRDGRTRRAPKPKAVKPPPTLADEINGFIRKLHSLSDTRRDIKVWYEKNQKAISKEGKVALARNLYFHAEEFNLIAEYIEHGRDPDLVRSCGDLVLED